LSHIFYHKFDVGDIIASTNGCYRLITNLRHAATTGSYIYDYIELLDNDKEPRYADFDSEQDWGYADWIDKRFSKVA
jgi:hypothetical protein